MYFTAHWLVEQSQLQVAMLWLKKQGDCAAAYHQRLSATCLAPALQVVYDLCFCTSVGRLDGQASCSVHYV